MQRLFSFFKSVERGLILSSVGNCEDIKPSSSPPSKTEGNQGENELFIHHRCSPQVTSPTVTSDERSPKKKRNLKTKGK